MLLDGGESDRMRALAHAGDGNAVRTKTYDEQDLTMLFVINRQTGKLQPLLAITSPVRRSDP
jgi:hypothetical protein